MSFFEEIERLVMSKIGVLKSLFTLIKLEAKLAGLSIIPLIITVFCLMILSLSTWLTTLILLGFCLQLLLNNALLSILLVFFLNLVIGFILIKRLIYNLKNMSFEKTREYFSKKEEDENFQKEIVGPNRPDEQKLTRL